MVPLPVSETESEPLTYNRPSARMIPNRPCANDSVLNAENTSASGDRPAVATDSVELIPLPAFIVAEPGGEILSANPLAMTLYGFSASELLSMRFADLMFAKTKGRHGAMDRAQHVTRGKRPIDVEVYARDVIAAGGAAQLVVVNDITASVEAINRLSGSHARYRHLFETSHELIVGIDVAGRIIHANAASQRALGYPAQTIPCLTLTDVVSPDSYETFLEALARCVCGDPVDNLETTLRARDGRLIIVEGSMAPLPNGSVVEVVGLFRDVTSRRRAEQWLREVQARQEAFVDNAVDLMYCVDTGAHFTFVNAVASRVLGFARSELIGMSSLDFIRHDYRQAAREAYGRQLREGLPNTYMEFPVVSGSGAEVWLGQNVQPVYENGNVVGLQGFARDITEQKRAERKVTSIKSAVAPSAESIAVAMDVHLARAKAAVEELVRATASERSGAERVAMTEVGLLQDVVAQMLALCRLAMREPRGPEPFEVQSDGG